MTDVKLWLLHSNTWNHLTVCQKKKWAQARLKVLSRKCFYKSYIIYMYKQDLALINLKVLICHKTQTNQTNSCDQKPSNLNIE